MHFKVEADIIRACKKWFKGVLTRPCIASPSDYSSCAILDLPMDDEKSSVCHALGTAATHIHMSPALMPPPIVNKRTTPYVRRRCVHHCDSDTQPLEAAGSDAAKHNDMHAHAAVLWSLKRQYAHTPGMHAFVVENTLCETGDTTTQYTTWRPCRFSTHEHKC
jgi:hypothetical protein